MGGLAAAVWSEWEASGLGAPLALPPPPMLPPPPTMLLPPPPTMLPPPPAAEESGFREKESKQEREARKRREKKERQLANRGPAGGGSSEGALVGHLFTSSGGSLPLSPTLLCLGRRRKPSPRPRRRLSMTCPALQSSATGPPIRPG